MKAKEKNILFAALGMAFGFAAGKRLTKDQSDETVSGHCCQDQPMTLGKKKY